MGKYSRIKGGQGERELMQLLLDDGFKVQRTFGSGAGKHQKGDIVLRFKNKNYVIECKREAHLPIKGLESRKSDSDILIMRQNRGGWKAYMDLDILTLLLLNNRS